MSNVKRHYPPYLGGQPRPRAGAALQSQIGPRGPKGVKRANQPRPGAGRTSGGSRPSADADVTHRGMLASGISSASARQPDTPGEPCDNPPVDFSMLCAGLCPNRHNPRLFFRDGRSGYVSARHRRPCGYGPPLTPRSVTCRDSETSGQRSAPAVRNAPTRANELPAPRDIAAVGTAISPCGYSR